MGSLGRAGLDVRAAVFAFMVARREISAVVGRFGFGGAAPEILLAPGRAWRSLAASSRSSPERGLRWSSSRRRLFSASGGRGWATVSGVLWRRKFRPPQPSDTREETPRERIRFMVLKPGYIICPVCGIGELRPDPFLVRCSGCDYVLSRNLFLVLRQIRALPEAEPARQRVAEYPRQDEPARRGEGDDSSGSGSRRS